MEKMKGARNQCFVGRRQQFGYIVRIPGDFGSRVERGGF
mgnify:CR=1 FL=1